MNKITIQVVTSDSAHVVDFEAMNVGVRRFINRTYVNGVWVKDSEPSTVFKTPDILRAIECKDLLIFVAPKQTEKNIKE